VRKKNTTVYLLIFALIFALVGCSAPASSGGNEPEKIDYPTKPIDMTIVFGAGISADIFGRKLASLAEKELGQPIVVNNRPGAGGAVGYQHVVQQKPDGYNIVWTSNSLSTTYHQGNMPISYEAFRSVARISTEQSVVAVKADAPWQTFEEFIEDAKNRPEEIAVGNGGIGSFNHLTAVAIENATGAKFHHVPFNATSAVPGLLGGQVDATVTMAFSFIPLAQSGEVRFLVSTGENRLENVKEVPTMKELGYDFSMLMYRGISVPKDTPDYVVEGLESAFKKATETEEYKKFIKENSIDAAWLGAEDCEKFIAKEDVFLGDLMSQIGMKK